MARILRADEAAEALSSEQESAREQAASLLSNWLADIDWGGPDRSKIVSLEGLSRITNVTGAVSDEADEKGDKVLRAVIRQHKEAGWDIELGFNPENGEHYLDIHNPTVPYSQQLQSKDRRSDTLENAPRSFRGNPLHRPIASLLITVFSIATCLWFLVSIWSYARLIAMLPIIGVLIILVLRRR